jgi:hypothetical protein
MHGPWHFSPTFTCAQNNAVFTSSQKDTGNGPQYSCVVSTVERTTHRNHDFSASILPQRYRSVRARVQTSITYKPHTVLQANPP